MSDYIVRAMAANSQIRAFAATTKDIVEEAKNIHNTSPVATVALGRLLTGGAMMGVMMKGDKYVLTLQIECNGPIGGLVVTSDSKGNVKGYVNNPDVMLPPNAKGQIDVAKALDLGVLSVIKDIGLKEPYVGQTILVTSEIAEDLTYYFMESEQVPSSVGLGVLMNKDNTVRQAGGFIIQLMPDTSDEIIDKLEEKIKSITSVTAMLEEEKTPELILEYILGDFGLEITETIPTGYHCNCSRERVEKALISIGKNELKEMIKEGKDEEVNCHFCNKKYVFTTQDLKNIVTKEILSKVKIIE